MLNTTSIDWTKLGEALRESALDAHDGDLPAVDIAYSFLLDNPECFMAFPTCARCGKREGDMLLGDVPVCADCATQDEALNGNPAWCEWPADMPQEPNIELIAAYYAGMEASC